MNKFMKGLGTIVLAAYAGCASQPVEAPKVPKNVEITADYLTLADASRVKAREDNAYMPAEVSDIIFQYETLKMSEKSVKSDVKKPYNNAVADCEKTINSAFDNADIYAYVGIVTDKGAGNAARNYGGDKPLYVGKGKDVAKHFDMRQKIELLLKAGVAWPKLVDGNAVSLENVYKSTMGVDRKKFAEVLKAREKFGVYESTGSHYVDAAKWASLTDDQCETNCEVRDNHLRFMAAYNGHQVEQKKADK